MDEKPLDPEAIDALLQTTGKAARPARPGRKGGGNGGDGPPRRPTRRGEPADDRPEADPGGPPAPAPGPRRTGASPQQVYASISQVPVEIAVVLGDLEMPIAEILRMKPGSVVQLDTWIDAPVEIRMRGRTVARAQIVTLEDTYALRIVENLIAAPDFRSE